MCPITSAGSLIYRSPLLVLLFLGLICGTAKGGRARRVRINLFEWWDIPAKQNLGYRDR